MIMDLELGIMKALITVRESSYIELIFSKKMSVQGQRLLPKQTARKMLKIVKYDQNRDFQHRFQGSQGTHKQIFDVDRNNLIRPCYEKAFMEKYQKLAEMFSKNSNIMHYVHTTTLVMRDRASLLIKFGKSFKSCPKGS